MMRNDGKTLDVEPLALDTLCDLSLILSKIFEESLTEPIRQPRRSWPRFGVRCQLISIRKVRKGLATCEAVSRAGSWQQS